MLRRPALAVLILGICCSSASAEPTFSGTLVTPTRLGPTTRVILYYLRMSSGPQEERFSVRMDPPRFATQGGRDEGESIDGALAIALQGPGTIGQKVQEPAFEVPCSSRQDRAHGYATGAESVDLLLPPDSATTLAVRYETGAQAPWVDGDYRLTFTAQPALVGQYTEDSPFFAGATLLTPVTLRTQGPLVGSGIAAHLVLTSSPHGSWSPSAAPRAVSRRTPITVSGRLLPSVAGRNVILEAAHNGGPLRTLFTVHTNARGRFSAPGWLPGVTGTYQVWARYPRQAGSLLADSTSCPLRFRVH